MTYMTCLTAELDERAPYAVPNTSTVGRGPTTTLLIVMLASAGMATARGLYCGSRVVVS